MAKQTSTPSEENVFQLLRKLEDSKKSHLESAVADIQKRFQGIAEDIKLLGQPGFLTNPAFEQAIAELGLQLKSEAVQKRKSSGSTVKPVKDTPLAKEIVEAVKAKGKVDGEGLVKALEGKAAKNTIINYAGRLVSEGVLHRPERGVFAVRD